MCVLSQALSLPHTHTHTHTHTPPCFSKQHHAAQTRLRQPWIRASFMNPEPIVLTSRFEFSDPIVVTNMYEITREEKKTLFFTSFPISADFR